MNADGLIDRILVETTGDKESANKLMREYFLAMVGDWCARRDFYSEIVQQNPYSAHLWELILPVIDDWLATLRNNPLLTFEPASPDDPIEKYVNEHPEAWDLLTDYFTCPLAPEEFLAAYRALWGDPDAI